MDRQKIIAFMTDKKYKPMTLEELQYEFGVLADRASFFQKVLKSLEHEGKVVRTRTGKYAVPERLNLIAGTYRGHPRGFGFLVCDAGGNDVFIPQKDSLGAMNNDRVLVRVRRLPGRYDSAEGEVVRIVKRANRTVVGTYEGGKHFGYVQPDERRLPFDIYVPKGAERNARSGDKVIVSITRWPEVHRNPEGEVIEVLGQRDDPGVQTRMTMEKFGLSPEFDKEVLFWASSLPSDIRAEDVRGREDFRDTPTVTIDGEDARDFDDAVSIRKTHSGWELSVHIADVSHYVTEGSPADSEAARRGCTVYLVEKALHMLPEQLATDLCSLKEGQDRLTVSVIMEIDFSGDVLSYRFAESVITNKKRLTYTEVQDAFEGRSAHLPGDLRGMLWQMKTLAEILREKRMARGSLDLDFQEEKVIMDEDGRVTGIEVRRRTWAEQVIEEFMIKANEVVAEHCYRSGIPFIYRVHEEPEPEKMQKLLYVLSSMGIRLEAGRKVRPGMLQKTIEKAKGTPAELPVSQMCLRSLKKARYSAEHGKHYGLASDYYTHFTSPIRRYPDLWAHRLLKEMLHTKRWSAQRIDYLEKVLPEIAHQSSIMERVAEEAERDSLEQKKLEYIKGFVGCTFNGIIVGVVDYGLYVRLENSVEGLVHASTLMDDLYSFDTERMIAFGEMTRKKLRLGDKVVVKLLDVDVDERRVDLSLVRGSSERAMGVARSEKAGKKNRVRKQKS
ncbi:MAG: ribonuclease R [Bacillota bacterium]